MFQADNIDEKNWELTESSKGCVRHWRINNYNLQI